MWQIVSAGKPGAQGWVEEVTPLQLTIFITRCYNLLNPTPLFSHPSIRNPYSSSHLPQTPNPKPDLTAKHNARGGLG